jgi:hypothetical protein
MKVSRISFPTNSPAAPESDGRAYLDMIGGVLHVVTTDGAVAVGDAYLNIVENALVGYTIGIANHADYIRKSFATACTITIPKQSVVAFPNGTYFEVKNVGAGTCTITPVDGDVTIIGTAALTTGKYAKVIRVSSNVWEVVGVV